jgi:hypothetical protein
MENYAISLGLFSFANPFVRDVVVDITYTIYDWLEVTFVKHDEALNMRPANLGQEKWIMFLSFPLDYQAEYWFERAVDLYCRLILWHTINDNHNSHACVLVKVQLMSDALVPRSFVLRKMGGRRRSWTVPVYLLRFDQWNDHIHDVPVDAEEEPPADGNPHPFHGPHTTAE